MQRPNYPTVTATVIDEDTVHIGGDFFKRESTCRRLDMGSAFDGGIHLLVCNQCGRASYAMPNGDAWAFCPNCGARVERDA